VKDVQFWIREVEIEPLAFNAQSSEPHGEAKMPAGYDFDVSLAETIPPGQSLLFSVPVTHRVNHDTSKSRTGLTYHRAKANGSRLLVASRKWFCSIPAGICPRKFSSS
jgi:hypothetical protein